jgi:hypothetical protein
MYLFVGGNFGRRPPEGGTTNDFAVLPREIRRIARTTRQLLFVAEAGEKLWNTKEPGRFERAKLGKKPQFSGASVRHSSRWLALPGFLPLEGPQRLRPV